MSRELISAADAAGQLGVRPATLYAYVSRGLLRSHRLPGRRGSWFDPAEIDARAKGKTHAKATGLDLTISSRLTRIDGRALSYRGRDAVELSRRASFESVASLLWSDVLRHEPFRASAEMTRAARQATRWLRPDARLADRLALIIAGAASADPLHFDLSTPAVLSSGRLLIATLVDGLPRVSGADPPMLVLDDGAVVESSIAGRLWVRLAPGRPPKDAASVLNGFLVLLADHELATSTVAARVAASTRANPYAAVLAALGTLDGPLHGTVCEEVHALLTQAAGPRGPRAAIADRLRLGLTVPGFGHSLYTEGDPRGRAGLQLVRRLATDAKMHGRLRVVEQLRATAGARTPAESNSDFSLGALAFVAGMAPDAGEAIFAIARTAGWIAHVLEEYTEAPLRFRAGSVYTG